MKNLSILFSFFLFTITSISQNEVNNYVEIRDQLKVLGEESTGFKNMDGSPYLEEEFVPGVIIEEGKKNQPAFFRYNVRKDQVEIKVDEDGDDIFVLPRTNNFSFKLNDYTYVVDNLKTKENKILMGYIQEFYKGDKLVLIGKPSINISAPRAPETSYDKGRPAKQTTINHYYFGFAGEPLEEIKLKEKTFRKIFEEDFMESYFKENKVKEIDDFIDMLQFYESNS